MLFGFYFDCIRAFLFELQVKMLHLVDGPDPVLELPIAVDPPLELENLEKSRCSKNHCNRSKSFKNCSYMSVMVFWSDLG